MSKALRLSIEQIEALEELIQNLREQGHLIGAEVIALLQATLDKLEDEIRLDAIAAHPRAQIGSNSGNMPPQSSGSPDSSISRSIAVVKS